MTPVRLAAAAMASAAAAGLSLVTATVLAVRTLQPPASTKDPQLGLFFYVLVFGTIAGLVAAGGVAWRLLAPIGTYRRGGLAVVSAFATVLLMLVCMPVDRLLGKPGLVGLLVVCAAVSLLLGRLARRAGPTVVPPVA